MSAWLARARERRAEAARVASAACANCANCAKTPDVRVPEGGFGTFGTIGTAPLVPVAEVRARLLWWMRRLQEEHGLTAEMAADRAKRIVASDLRNDVRMVPVQSDPRSCLVCAARGEATRVLVPVLTPRPGEFLWMHLAPCHEEFVQEQRPKIAGLIECALKLVDTS